MTNYFCHQIVSYIHHPTAINEHSRHYYNTTSFSEISHKTIPFLINILFFTPSIVKLNYRDISVHQILKKMTKGK